MSPFLAVEQCCTAVSQACRVAIAIIAAVIMLLPFSSSMPVLVCYDMPIAIFALLLKEAGDIHGIVQSINYT